MFWLKIAGHFDLCVGTIITCMIKDTLISSSCNLERLSECQHATARLH